MPDQQDYGAKAEPQLVPQSLRVYRHFMMDTHTGHLWRMGNGLLDRDGRFAEMDRAYQATELHHAVCQKSRGGWYASVPPPEGHDAPNRDCTCGFYASYAPETDFYPGQSWGEEYCKEFIANRPGRRDKEEAADYVIVRAVVEMQGRVIMGRLGVRAEKMKIVAVAIDWSKHMYEDRPGREVASIDWSSPGDILRIAGRGQPVFVDSFWSNKSWKTGMPPRGEKRYVFDTSYNVWDMKDDDPVIPVKVLDNVSEVEDKVRRQLVKYGVKFYTDVDKMHAEHPKPDLSALGLEPESEPPEISPYTVTVTANGNIVLDPATVKRVFGANPSSSYSLPSGGYTPRKKKPKKKRFADIRNDVIRNALEAKQNRQAPPGTGIDRRKGRLR